MSVIHQLSVESTLNRPSTADYRIRAVLMGNVHTNTGVPVDLPCLRCGSTVEVLMECSRTSYDTSRVRTRYERILEPNPPDPNAPIPLCRECAEDHHEYWDEMWSNYYSGVM